MKKQRPARGPPRRRARRRGDAASRAIAGTQFATEVYAAFKQNYAIEGVEPTLVAGLSATVIVRIDRDGRFIDHRIERSSGRALRPRRRAARSCAAARCRRRPRSSGQGTRRRRGSFPALKMVRAVTTEHSMTLITHVVAICLKLLAFVPAPWRSRDAHRRNVCASSSAGPTSAPIRSRRRR